MRVGDILNDACTSSTFIKRTGVIRTHTVKVFGARSLAERSRHHAHLPRPAPAAAASARACHRRRRRRRRLRSRLARLRRLLIEGCGVLARRFLRQRPPLLVIPGAPALLAVQLVVGALVLRISQLTAPAKHAALVGERATRPQLVAISGVGDGMRSKPQPRALGHLGVGGLDPVTILLLGRMLSPAGVGNSGARTRARTRPSPASSAALP